MVVPSMEIVQKPQELFPSILMIILMVIRCFLSIQSRFDNHFDLMRRRETSFFKVQIGRFSSNVLGVLLFHRRDLQMFLGVFLFHRRF
mgnify:CR=1 FL=1